MSEPERDELPADIRALLDEESRRPDPGADRVERIREGALREIAARLPPSSAPGAGAGGPSRRAPLWFVSGMLVGGLIVGALMRRGPAPSVVVTNVVVVTVDAAVVARASAAGASSAGEDAQPADADAARPPDEPPSPPPRARAVAVGDGPSEPRDSSLRAERELIETAQSALARRQWRDAVAACESHLRRFARAQFVEEREAIWIQALAGEGREAEAWARAESFRRRFSSSFLRAVVDRVAPAVSNRDR
jgi:hypothetical protein